MIGLLGLEPSGADSSGGGCWGAAGAACSLRISQPRERVAARGGATAPWAAAGRARHARASAVPRMGTRRDIVGCNRPNGMGVAAGPPENLAIDALARGAAHGSGPPTDRRRPAVRTGPAKLPLADGDVRAHRVRAGGGGPRGAGLRPVL